MKKTDKIKNVVIQMSGKGERALWHIIEAKSPYSIATDVFFDSKEQAVNFANKKKYNIVENYEKTDKMKKFNPKSLIGRNVWKQSGATGVFKILEIKEVEPDNLKMEIGTNTYSMTVSYTMQDLIDLSKGKIIKDLELLKDFKTTKLKENKMKTGGYLDKENSDMVLNNNKQISHHTKELANAVNKNKNIPAWVVAKVNRSATDISDATHYLEGTKYKKGGGVEKNSKIAEFHKNFADGGQKTKIRSWYIKTYPKDNRGKYIDLSNTFEDLWNAIQNKENVYDVIVEGDSLIRERLFEKLSQIKGIKYIDIYNKWLDSDENEMANGGNLGTNYTIGGL